MKVDPEKLRFLREEKVFSQRELARRAEITHMTYWNLEHGYREARPRTIRKLAEALEVEPKELIERKEEQSG